MRILFGLILYVMALASSHGATLTHKVVSGDTLWGLSREYGVSVTELKARNGLRGSTIYIGQKLVIQEKVEYDYHLHTVESGEALSILAQKYDSTVQLIKTRNKLTSDTIYIDQVLMIPIIKKTYTPPAPPKEKKPHQFNYRNHYPVVVLDAGHGGSDPGGGDDWGIEEKVLNYRTAKKVEAKLRAAGYRVFLTRNGPHKVSLQKRAQIANWYCKKYSHVIFVSVHYNEAETYSARGIETFYFGQGKSKALADAVQQGMLSKVKMPNRKVKYSSKYYVLKNTKCPAIILEGGFMSNSQDRKVIGQDWYQHQLAEGIVLGVQNYTKRYHQYL